MSVYVNGPVVTRYIGVAGVLLAVMDAEIAEHKEKERERRKAWEWEETRRYHEFKKRTATVNTLLVTVLNAFGFVRQNCSPRRKSRVQTLPRKYTNRGDAEIRERMRELVRDYCRDVPNAIEELAEPARRYPQEFAAELEMDMTGMAVKGLINYELSKCDAYSAKLRADWLARIGVMVHELAGENASPARRLCAALVALADTKFWLLMMQAGSTGVRTEAILSTRRRTFAHKRYLAALKTFSQIEAAERRPRRMVQVVMAEV
jgi:hypothetical protein